LDSYFVGLLTLVVRRSALESLDYPCDPRYHIIGDLDLVVRLSVNWKLDCVQEPIAVCRLHGENETTKNHDRECEEMEIWLRDMVEKKVISDSGKVRQFHSKTEYLRGKNLIFRSERKAAFSVFRGMHFCYWKLRLLLALITPLGVAKELACTIHESP